MSQFYHQFRHYFAIKQRNMSEATAIDKIVAYGLSHSQHWWHGRPQTFFQGGAKNFQGRQEHIFCLKSTKKHTIFLKKVQKHTIFGRPWPISRGARDPVAPPPADAHDWWRIKN
jgi:hypothetical protein